jgi:hypothetical protein
MELFTAKTALEGKIKGSLPIKFSSEHLKTVKIGL